MEKVIFDISGMHCASCASSIEDALKKVNGILNAEVNFATEKAYIEFNPAKIGTEMLISIIEKTGYKVLPTDLSLEQKKELAERSLKRLKINAIIAIALSGVLMLSAMVAMGTMSKGTSTATDMIFLQFLLATGVLVCGHDFFVKGYKTVVLNHRANMDTLIALGVGSAYFYSLPVSLAILSGNSSLGVHDLYYEVAAFLISFILLGRYLEAKTKSKTSEAMKKLMDLKPKIAYVEKEGGQQAVPVGDLVLGDIVVVKPGQMIPTDGRIIEGYSSIDESMLTGESIPVDKSVSNLVFGGTLNKTGTFKFKVTRIGRQTALAKIIELIEEAQGSKAPVQALADRIAAVFVPAVLAIALVSFFAWILMGKSFSFALSTFIAVLIIACPCSLGLATPTAVMVACGLAAENGIIIKNAASLQVALAAKKVIFDKTGTLTTGEPMLTNVVSYIHDETEVLRMAVAIEKKSEHPLAQAIVHAERAKYLLVPDVEEFQAFSGKGVEAKILGSQILLGNRALMLGYNIDLEVAKADLDRFESQGRTVMILARAGKVIGLVAVRDHLKEFSKECVEKLKSMGKEVAMLTGDNRMTAYALAQELGIEEVLAEILPQDKVGEVKRLQSQGAKVIFVGDGLNDAPALAQADLGIAIGTGVDVAIESAEMILIKDDLRGVVTAIDLSRFAMKKIKENLFWSFAYNIIGIPIAAGLLYPSTGFLLNPVVAGIAMALSSISVVLNSLSMHKYKKERWG